MKNVRIFFTLSSALIVAASVFGVSADAQKSDLDQCTAGGLSKAECACAIALETGTKEALRDFLNLYRNADTACNALASTATVGSGGDVISSNGASSNGASSNGASSSGANPGNDEPVGNAGESPGPGDYGDSGAKGVSQ